MFVRRVNLLFFVVCATFALCMIGGVTDAIAKTVAIKHAAYFTIDKREGGLLLTVKSPWEGAKPRHYWLSSTAAPSPQADAHVVSTPTTRAVSLTTTNLAYFDALGVEDSLVGLANSGHVNTPSIRKRIEAKAIRDVGIGPTIDKEALVLLKPDAVFTYGMGDPNSDSHGIIATLGITPVIQAAYREESVLGRCEWIKFIAAFYGKLPEATAYFDAVEARYLALKQIVSAVSKKPTVFFNAPYRGTWYMPGGHSYMAKLISDAGGHYLWHDTTGVASLRLDLETVLVKARNADVWLNGSFHWKTLQQVKADDQRLAQFSAYKHKRLYTNNAKVNAKGGNDYFEGAIVQPDKLLHDVIAILHPSLAKGHSLHWYQQLGDQL